MSKTTKTILWVIVVIIIIGGIWYGVSRKPQNQPQSPVGKEPIKIGVLADLSGPSAWIGKYQREGIDLAISEINEKGGLNGKKLIAIYEDDQGQSSQGVTAFNKLILQKPNVLVVSLSSVANSVLPLINRNKIPTFFVAVSLPNITDKSEWVFRTHIGSDDEAKIIAKFLERKFPKIDSVAVVYVNDEFGVGGSKIFQQKFPGKVVVKEAFSKTQSDFKTIVAKIKNSNAKAIYILGYTLAVPNLLKQLKEMNVKLPIITNLAIASPSLIKAAGEAINGVYLPALLVSYKNPKDPVVKKFVDAYRKKYKRNSSLFSAFSYTAVKIFERALQEKGSTASLIKDGILEIKNFSTPVGKISVLPNGNIKFPLKIVQIINGSFVDVFIPE